MYAYAVVAAKPGRSIPARVLAALDEPQMSSLLFTAESHVRWNDKTGRVCFAAWQRDAGALGIGCRWEVRPSGVTAFSGHLWPRSTPWVSGRTWASQLADRFERVPLNASLDAYQGVYTAVSITSNGGGAIACDPFAFGQLFVGQTEDVFVISPRAAVVAQLLEAAGKPPRRDTEAVASMIYASFVLGSRSGYEGVELVAPGEYVSLSGPMLRSWSRTPWLPMTDEPRDLPDIVECVRAELMGSLHALAAVDARQRRANLTGGRDSRLVLALLLSEGLTDRFEFNTMGAADLPDTMIASLIADRFNLRHRAASSDTACPSSDLDPKRTAVAAAPDIGFEDSLRHHVWATSGLGHPWDLKTPVRTRSNQMALTGMFGETYRTRYVRAARLTNAEQLIAYVRRAGFGFQCPLLLNDDARVHFESKVGREIAELAAFGNAPLTALDGFYLTGPLRRWFAPQLELDANHRVFPLYSLTATRAAFALGPSARVSQRLIYELMRGACAELTELPFASSSWPDELFSELRNGRRLRKAIARSTSRVATAAATAATAATAKPSTAGQDMQARAVDERLPVLRRCLDLGYAHPLFDWVDRDSLTRALDDYATLNFAARRSVFAAAGAAIWLERAEAPAPAL